MTNIKVVGVTYENRQELIQRVIEAYKAKGKLLSWEGLSDKEIIEESMDGTEFEGQLLKGVITLEEEPDNPYDPNAIKVYIRDAQNKKYHVGYIPKEQTQKVKQLMKRTTRIDAEFTGGREKLVDIDDNDNEYITNDTLTTGLMLHLVDVVEATKNNPLLKEGDGSTKTKVTNRIGCGIMLFIIVLLIIILFF